MPCFCIWNMEKERIKEIIEPIVNDHGCDFWGLEISQGKRIPTLRVFIDAINGATIDDCENISRDLNLELSLDSDFIEDYVLEVSTPGLDRKFFYSYQLNDFVGKTLKIKLKEKINDKKTFKAILKSVKNDSLELGLGKEELTIDFEIIRISFELQNFICSFYFQPCPKRGIVCAAWASQFPIRTIHCVKILPPLILKSHFLHFWL